MCHFYSRMGNRGDTPLARAARLAAGSHAILTSRQLHDCGLTNKSIHDAVRRGTLHTTPFTAVFSIGTPLTTAYQRALAAVLASGGLLSHHWCRWLFGVGRLPRHDPDVTVTANRRKRAGLILHRTRGPLTPDANHGIPCTRPERMVIDCAPDLTAQDLRRLVNDAQIHHLVSVPSLMAAARDTRGRDTSALTALLREAPRGATRSLLEDLLNDLSDERGLPRPKTNAIVDGVEVDFAYYDGAIVIEADGYEFHRTKQAFERDREKRLGLEANGRRVLWVSYRQVTELRDRTADELEAIISRAPTPTSTRDSPSSATRPGDEPVYGRVPAGSA